MIEFWSVNLQKKLINFEKFLYRLVISISTFDENYNLENFRFGLKLVYNIIPYDIFKKLNGLFNLF